MSKTVNISSPSQFSEVLQGSKLVVADCKHRSTAPRVNSIYPAIHGWGSSSWSR